MAASTLDNNAMAAGDDVSGRDDLAHALTALLGSRARRDESLARRSSLRIGGVADHWVEPHSVEELSQVCQLATDAGVPIQVAGLGSNTLFPDEGLRGVTIRMGGELARWEILDTDSDTTEVKVGAGTINAHLVRGLLSAGLVDAEFLVLIPGTFGGAIVMNAGTKEAELSSILTSVTLLIPDSDSAGWQLAVMTPEQLEMRYRHATLPEGALVVDGTITLREGDVEAAEQAAKQDKERRNRTQPYKLASVGSTFANPPGDYAGRLIEAVGLKGVARGGARISELHANFFINEGGASAADFLSLMALARVRVRRDFNIDLTPEVRFVGFDGARELARIERSLMEAEEGGDV